MKSKYGLQDLFSRHEIAAGGWIIAIILLVCGAIALGSAGFAGTGLRYAVGIPLFVAAPVILVTAMEYGRCPTCGKNPMVMPKGDQNWLEHYVAMHRNSFWPESRCSKCGTELDIRP